MPHGTRTYYVRKKCRCEPCTQAERDYQRLHRATINRIRRRGLVPSGPTVARINSLLSQGLSHRAIAMHAGLSEMAVVHIARRGSRRVRQSTADKIASVPDVRVTAVGIQRRMRALAAIGWNAEQIAEVAGVNLDTVKTVARGDVIPRPPTRDALLKAWDELHMKRREAHDHDSRLSLSRTLAWAREHGYVPPLAWDDIDDPNEVPDLGERHRGRGVDLDEWLFLVRGGEDPVRAARRLGVGIQAVDRKAWRDGRRDVLELCTAAAQRERRPKERKSA